MDNILIKNQDLKYIFHPCSQMKDYEKNLPLIPIKKAKGVYLYDFENNRYIDAISSWWVNIFGHSNKKINKAIYKQTKKLEHVIFAGFTHKPAIKLAKKLVKITPKNLNKVFFADNGSSAIEVAIKMSFHYFKNKNKLKPIVVSLQNSYHGETLGALSVGDVELYKQTYKELLFKTIQAKSPALTNECEAIADLENIFKQHHKKICCFVIEPLIQCAGNMKMYQPSYLKKASKLCKQYNIHLIADEIAVGFGRTGKMFGVNSAKISPDFMALSKGLTGGYLPLSVVMLTDKIYNSFYDDYLKNKNFLHSHSYTGNPIGCAAALKSLELFKKKKILQKNKKKIAFISKELKKFQSLPNVKETRQQGMVAAIELQGYKPEERINLKIYQYALKNGVFLRPLGNVVYIMPPFIIKKKQLKKVLDTAYEIISQI
jgi:adenosylmethionine-8-amino-7-oxononanoate aminotransferase